MPVFSTFMGGFGDAWGAANYFLRLSEENGAPTMVFDLDPRIREIIPHLNASGSVLEVATPADVLIHSHPNPNLLLSLYRHTVPSTVLSWEVVFTHQYFRTKASIWRPQKNKVVAVQLTPRYPDDKKSCPQENRDSFYEQMRLEGYSVVEMGLPASIGENISIASNVDFFVGVCSGMSHLCHSVGTPVHLIQNKQDPSTLSICHRGNPYQRYASLPDFVSALPTISESIFSSEASTSYSG